MNTPATSVAGAAAEFRILPVHLIFLSIVIGLLLFPGLRHGDLSGYDDALYAHEAKEMLESGDWWSVRFNGTLNFEYPPMFLWMEAASLEIFGVRDFAAKLPAAMAGFGTILTVYFLALEVTRDRWLAIVSMFVLGSTQFFLKYSAHAMTDVPFTFFFTLALLLYLKGIRRPRYLLLLGMPVGCAILTRSVVGILPLVVIIVHSVLTGRGRLLRSVHWIGGCLIALGMPLAWGASQYHLYGSRFLDGHFAFVAGKAGAGWAPSLDMLGYLWLLLRHYWPWLPFLLIGLALQLRALQQRREVPALLALVWFAVVIVPFSLAETKYARYLIPAFPALSIISAIGICHWIPARRRRLALHAGCVALLIAGLAFQILFPPRERASDMKVLAPIAEANSEPGEFVLLYTYGTTGYDYQNQLLWYGNRYSELLTNPQVLAERLGRQPRAVGIIDRPSFEVLSAQLGPSRQPEIVGQSERFLCYRLRE